jgi:predicted nuclease of restriction endonuclease-like (RecB) superfamily
MTLIFIYGLTTKALTLQSIIDCRMDLQQHFEQVRQLIRRGRSNALQAAYTEQLNAYWQVGAYIYYRLQNAEWGEKTVEHLAIWLKENEPTLKGFDRRSIYRMKEFFQTWHELDWKALKKDGTVIVATVSPQLQSVMNQSNEFVVTAPPQISEFPNILASLNWSHHIEILSKTASLEEKVFYLLLAIKERYSVRDLRRQIDSGLYERQKLSKAHLTAQHPNADIIPQIFRDKYIFEFIDLPDSFTEDDLQKAFVRRLKQFILEIGRDFTFIGEEYRIQVGMQDYFLDLLFFHRELQCLVAFELKITSFKPEYLGKLNFYLEALDREVKKPHENPSIGVLLCTAKNKEVVEFALSRNISPALIAEYETKLIDKNLLQRMLHEWTENIVSDK